MEHPRHKPVGRRGLEERRRGAVLTGRAAALGVWLAAGALAAALSACKSSTAPKVLAWSELSPGFTHTEFDTGEFQGHAFDVDLEKAAVHVVPAAGRQPVDAIVAAAPAGLGAEYLATNASFFDDKDHPMGRVVDGGRFLSVDRRGPWGALVVEGRNARIVLGDALPESAHGTPPAEPAGDVVVQGIPRLVVGGEVPKLKEAKAERTAVCAGFQKLTVVVSTAAETASFARFLALPRDKGGLGCKDALNLDGGPSTQLEANLGGKKIGVKGGWGVPNALVITPR